MFYKKSIVARWLVNVMAIVFLLLMTLLLTLSLLVQGYFYNGIQSSINASSMQMMNLFDSYRKSSASEFISGARSYVETLPDKERMEVMVLNSRGVVVTTSTGFAPDNTEAMPDYENALRDENGHGLWTGRLSTGERVMAVTRLMISNSGTTLGGIRYVVSLEKANRQVTTIILFILGGCLLVLLLISLSGLFFVKSIVRPVKQIGDTARQIAQGDFNARVEKVNDDELGQLCDTINEMATELNASEKMKNDFISSISHELRTPLTAIKGWSETMQGEGIDKKTYDKGLAVISREAGRLSGMVEELLDFSRMQSGRITLIMGKIDILAEVGEAVYMFSEKAKAEGKYLLYSEPEMISPVIGDVDRLRQVFINIIDNALKYTSEGGTVEVEVNEEDGFVHVVISDNGCGIPPEHLPHVKEKFYKANHTVRGSGIGLALANEIVEMHKGKLEIESHENIGTAVTITLPLARSEEQEQAKEGEKEPNE